MMPPPTPTAATPDATDHLSRWNDFCNSFHETRPAWVAGSISCSDTRFLFTEALSAGTNVAVEIGTASGYSTALLCHALNFGHAAGAVNEDYRVITYDAAAQFYLDKTRNVGDAARERLAPELLAHIAFRTPATAADVRRDFGKDEVDFAFIDANHKHPWPTLDTLALLDSLRPGATIVFHDINLPLRSPAFEGWGAKYVFDDLETTKRLSDDPELPNMGSIAIPDAKEPFRDQLLRILFGHLWEVDVDAGVVTRALA